MPQPVIKWHAGYFQPVLENENLQSADAWRELELDLMHKRNVDQSQFRAREDITDLHVLDLVGDGQPQPDHLAPAVRGRRRLLHRHLPLGRPLRRARVPPVQELEAGAPAAVEVDGLHQVGRAVGGGGEPPVGLLRRRGRRQVGPRLGRLVGPLVLKRKNIPFPVFGMPLPILLMIHVPIDQDQLFG